MGQPSISTIKRLFAVSGNKCAFPNCQSPIIEPTICKPIGKVCHIKANSPGGPRYDPTQSDDERQGFENLILLCPMHHDVIDSDVESYTVKRLHNMKKKHESAQQKQTEPSDEIAKQLIMNFNIYSPIEGSVIFSLNQSGGQVAHKITNVGYQPKQIPTNAIPEFLKLMKSLPPMEGHVTASILDNETHFIAKQLVQLLNQSGWNMSGDSLTMYSPNMPKGIIFIAPELTLSIDILTKFLKAVGFKNYFIFNESIKTFTIAVNGVE